MRYSIRLITIALVIVAAPAAAHATCGCSCVNGQMQPLCSSAIEVPPICPSTVCRVAPPSVTPIMPPQVPPVRTSQCHMMQVLNPSTETYQWQRVCQ
jgi:hypothetical protein